MAGYKNFQTDNFKYSENRTDIYNPAFNKTVTGIANDELDSFTKNLDKWIDFVSWARWFPDLWFDLITPETGGIRLDLDQRVFLRSLARFVQTYGVFPRGYGKTMIEVMGLVHTAIFYPDVEVTMTAQTRENATKLLEEKYRELIKFYPMIENEVKKCSFTKDSAEVIFHSGGRIDILANQQSTKGARRKRLNVEESALLNNALFEDVLEPIVNVPRRTIGKKCLINPEELNGQINFFTTSGFRGTDEFDRSLRMIDEMAELKGKLVLGASWELAVSYGRGEPRAALLEKQAKLSPTFFAQNYCSKWVGASDGALISLSKVMEIRTLPKPELHSDGKSEYILGVDVARSNNSSNNQSSVAILKLVRSRNGKIFNIQLVNLINLKNCLNFTAQAVEIKRIKNLYKAKAIIVDGNGLGKGLIDELLKETYDTLNNQNLGCYDTMNTDQIPDILDSEKIVYDFHAQGVNSEVIVNFIDTIESKKLQLIEKRAEKDYDIEDEDYIKNNVLPYIQTDFLLEEIANLKLKQLPSGKYTIEQVTKRINKDRYSALAYGLWYIKNFEDNIQSEEEFNIENYLLCDRGIM